MIKLIIGTFTTLFLLCTACIIFYWRDTGFDPSAMDLISYFFLLPLVLCALILSPYFIYKAIQFRKEQKIEAQKKAEEQAEQKELEVIEQAKPKPLEIQQISVNVFSSAAWHSYGENEQIVEDIQLFKSPELDQNLLNGYGLPVLSYRINDLDELTLDDDETDFNVTTMREKRIQALIQQQLEQHAESLYLIADHLKQSALFYDSELAYQYRMHPAWVNPNYAQEVDSDSVSQSQAPVSRLNRLNIHILLAEDLVHQWSDDYLNDIKNQLSESNGVIAEQIHIEAHFIGKSVAYTEWLRILEQISHQTSQVSLVISVDSEIDQECIDEKIWLQEQYIAAEYASSWCLANTQVNIQNLMPTKVLNVVINETDFAQSFKRKQLKDLPQFNQEQPFLFMLDDATDMKVVKKLQNKFDETATETYHFLYTKQNLGDTQHLAKIFGFMLGMHLPEELTAMMYSTDQESTFAFIQAFSEKEQLEPETI